MKYKGDQETKSSYAVNAPKTTQFLKFLQAAWLRLLAHSSHVEVAARMWRNDQWWNAVSLVSNGFNRFSEDNEETLIKYEQNGIYCEISKINGL